MKKSRKNEKNTTLLVAVAAVSLALLPAISLAADDERTVPTVAGCIEKTGLSEEKCTEMIEKMKNRPEGEGRGMRNGKPPMNGERRRGMEDSDNIRSGSFPQNGGMHNKNEIENAEKMKEKREKRFIRTEERIQKLIDFIKSKSIDTTEIEGYLATFKEKTSGILSAFDTYIQAIENYKNDKSDDNFEKVKEARENIKTLSKSLAEFYQENVRKNIKELLDQLRDNE